MAKRSGLDLCLKKYRHSSSSSTSERQNKLSIKIKFSLTENYPQKNAEILSAQYGTNVLLVGVALMLALSHHSHSVKEEHILSFITTLMILQLIWMLCYIVRRDRRKKKNLLPERDVHAGTSWLRGGLTMLALLSLIMDAFRIGYFVGYQSCISAVLGVYPVIHVLHTFSQVYFLWFHIKDVIKRCETFERFGVIHAVFTNLLLWCNGVMYETEHFMHNHKKRLSALGYENLTIVHNEPHCNCTTSACSIFSNSVYYLFPFNIEYHIFASTMLFVMWKNIGRTIDHHANHKHPTTRTTGLVPGPILGLVALASTIVVLVVYLTHVEKSLETRQAAIAMFYWYGIAMLACMCVASAAGLLIYRVEGLPMDTAENPSRQLDTALLFGTSLGSWLMSWCSVVAVGVAHSSPRYRWTSLAYSLLVVLEKYVQNLFIVESLYRQRREPEDGDRANSVTVPPEIFSVAASMVPPYNGIVNRAFENQARCCCSLEVVQMENGQVYCCTRKTVEVPRSTTTSPPPEEMPSMADRAFENQEMCCRSLEVVQMENGQVYCCTRKTVEVPRSTTTSPPPEEMPSMVDRAFENQERCCSSLEVVQMDNGQVYRCTRKTVEVPRSTTTSPLPEEVPSMVDRAFENQERCCRSLEVVQMENGQVYCCTRQTVEVPRSTTNPSPEETPSKKRQVLKNIAIFLILCNISLWILPAFSCRPQYDNGLEQELFGFTMWTAVLNFAIPLNLFYRMHSVASLFEVFQKV